MKLLNDSFPRFYGRRKGRKLSKAGNSYLQEGEKYFIKKENFSQDFLKLFRDVTTDKIILEIGFGNGDNLVQAAKSSTKDIFIGADPFLNSTAQCVQKLIKYNLNNVKIWPDDIKKIINFFPKNSITEVKILFPDPWPKSKHKTRRLIQTEFIEQLSRILINNGVVTIATDHHVLKSWILEKFNFNNNFEWTANDPIDWRRRPLDCFETKYEKKAYTESRIPSWFLFKKK